MHAMAFNYVDYIVIVILGISMLFACLRGFLGSFLSLAGWGLSVYLSYVTYPIFEPMLKAKIKNEIIMLMAGHSLLMLGFLILFGLFNIFANNALKGISKGMFDRFLGLGFGLLRGMLFVSFTFYIFITTLGIVSGTEIYNKANEADLDKEMPGAIAKSQSYPYLKMGRTLIEELIPSSFHDEIQFAYSKITKKNGEEVFMDAMSKRMEENLTPEQRVELQEFLDEASLTKSEKELEGIKTRKLMKYNSENALKGTTVKNPISDHDFQRIEKVIHDKSTLINTSPSSKSPPTLSDNASASNIELPNLTEVSPTHNEAEHLNGFIKN